MSKSLDERLIEQFHPERVKDTFLKYEEAKQDFFQSTVEIPMGADGISYETFKNELDCRCTFISQRVLNGTYLFYPFREIIVPKPSGKERVLSIATIRDVIVQKILYEVLYSEVEKLFKANYKLDRVSCAYRKRKSAPYAAKLIHQYIKQGFQFVLDADIVQFFDKIPHQELIALLENLCGQNINTSNLLRRFVKTGGISYIHDVRLRNKSIFHHYKPDRQKLLRTLGIPQGGVLSGMLANLYLHDFDCWIISDLSQKHELRYVRYADDFVILLRKESEIATVHEEVLHKLKAMKLQLHGLPKTRYVDIAKDTLEFVGFQFTIDSILIKQENIKKFQDRILEKIEQEPYYQFKGKAVRRFKLFIQNVLNRKILGRGEEICPVCNGVVGERVRSWIGFFSAITDITQLRELDKWIRVQVTKHFYRNYGLRLKRFHFRDANLASLEQEYYRVHKRKICLCDTSCTLETQPLVIPNPG
jgi:group II intron reverse transcriptase/maturase